MKNVLGFDHSGDRKPGNGISVCSKDSLNFFMKSSKVPSERVAEVKASYQRVDVQVAADPLLMYERVKVICCSSML